MKLVIGNLKMNLISEMERNNYLKSFENNLKKREFKNVQFVICPPFIHLETFSKRIKGAGIFLGAQNIYTEDRGKFTGEISSQMIKNFGGDYVIVGHSERRSIFGEDDKIVNKKAKIALKNNLIPIICVGETQKERDNGKIKNIISNQILSSLKDISRSKVSQVIIAYEPIWSIGSGKVPSGDEIMSVRILIQKILTDKFDLNFNKMPSIIYGGSVNCKNIKELCIGAGMDGVLVGGESLRMADFTKIGEMLEIN
jgi:triosephosphate isomerase